MVSALDPMHYAVRNEVRVGSMVNHSLVYQVSGFCTWVLTFSCPEQSLDPLYANFPLFSFSTEGGEGVLNYDFGTFGHDLNSMSGSF